MKVQNKIKTVSTLKILTFAFAVMLVSPQVRADGQAEKGEEIDPALIEANQPEGFSEFMRKMRHDVRDGIFGPGAEGMPDKRKGKDGKKYTLREVYGAKAAFGAGFFPSHTESLETFGDFMEPEAVFAKLGKAGGALAPRRIAFYNQCVDHSPITIRVAFYRSSDERKNSTKVAESDNRMNNIQKSFDYTDVVFKTPEACLNSLKKWVAQKAEAIQKKQDLKISSPAAGQESPMTMELAPRGVAAVTEKKVLYQPEAGEIQVQSASVDPDAMI